MLPTIFLSHGAPNLPLIDVPARAFLEGISDRIERPKAILVASAHWESRVSMVNAVERNETIHDFGNFDPKLFEMRYPAPGSVALAERVGDLLAAQGLENRADRARGLDHGAWVPLTLMYPDADIPVVQISIQGHLGPAHHLGVGRALEPLRREGVLVIGSGSYTHNLSEFRSYWGCPDAPEPRWVTTFADWFDAALAEQRISDLLAYRRLAPNAAKNHPTEEHVLPIYVAIGAAGPHARAERWHASLTYGVLRMDVYAFH